MWSPADVQAPCLTSCRLSMPQDANAAYVIAVACLIRRPGDAAGAAAAADAWAEAEACEEVHVLDVLPENSC